MNYILTKKKNPLANQNPKFGMFGPDYMYANIKYLQIYLTSE